MSQSQGMKSEASQLVRFLLKNLAKTALCQEIVSDLVRGVDYSAVRARLLPFVVSETRSIDQKPSVLKIRAADEVLTGLLVRYLERCGSCEFNQRTLKLILDNVGASVLSPKPNVIIKRLHAVSPILNLEVKDSVGAFDVGHFVVRPASPQEQHLMRPLASIERVLLASWETPVLTPLWVVESFLDVTLEVDQQIPSNKRTNTTQDTGRSTQMSVEWRTKFLKQFRETEEKVRNLLLALRLLKPEPVFIPQVCFTDILFPWQSFSVPLSASIVEPLWQDAYKVTQSDMPKLRELYTNLSHTLSRAKKEKHRAYLLRAASHFNKAGDEIEAGDAFIHYVIALEAMYLRPEEVMELKRRVCERAATLLYDVADRPEAYKTVGHMYDLRSGIVHGRLSESKKRDLETHLSQAKELVRRSLLCFADLDQIYDNKADIVALLDKSLLEGENQSIYKTMPADSMFRKIIKYAEE